MYMSMYLKTTGAMENNTGHGDNEIRRSVTYDPGRRTLFAKVCLSEYLL